MKKPKKMPKGFMWMEDRRGYRFKFTYEGKSHYVYGKTIKECEDKAAAKKEALQQHLNLENSKIALIAYYTEWWIPEQQKDVKNATLYTYKSRWEHLEKYFGHMKICDIKKDDVKSFQKSMLKDGKSEDTINTCVKLLKQILRSSITDRIICYNPCDGVKSFKADKTKITETSHRALTNEETNQFMDAAKDCHYYLLFDFLLNTGCRVSEALALTWFDVDMKRNEIHISKTVSRKPKGGFELSATPKTSSSKRSIPISPKISKILQEQKKRNHLLFPNCQWIFPNTRGGLANYPSVDCCIKVLIQKMNNNNSSDIFEHFAAHAFRDTFATRCIEQGMNPQTLKSLMGHKSLQMTMDLYAQVLPNTKAEELEKIVITG